MYVNEMLRERCLVFFVLNCYIEKKIWLDFFFHNVPASGGIFFYSLVLGCFQAMWVVLQVSF